MNQKGMADPWDKEGCPGVPGHCEFLQTVYKKLQKNHKATPWTDRECKVDVGEDCFWRASYAGHTRQWREVLGWVQHIWLCTGCSALANGKGWKMETGGFYDQRDGPGPMQLQNLQQKVASNNDHPGQVVASSAGSVGGLWGLDRPPESDFLPETPTDYTMVGKLG
jgi:hypothetical protein